MLEYKNHWTKSESLCSASLERDWDYFASMFDALRLYLFEHGSVPSWNFMFCGGKPELGNPQSWAYTLPSLFAYILPSNVALLAICVSLSILGFWSMRKLLLGWFNSETGAIFGATLFIFNGYIASRFSQGHVTFAFFSLIPFLILSFESAFQKCLDKTEFIKPSLSLLVGSWLLFTAGLPPTLFYFYPAFLLFVMIRVGVALRDENKTALQSGGKVLAFHALGLLLASYKLWPILMYQRENPRPGVELERLTFSRILANLTSRIDHYEALSAPIFAEQKWGLWEYNSYIGLMPICLALFALFFGYKIYQKQGPKDKIPSEGVAVLFSIGLIFLGVLLSLGNSHPLSPTAFFQHLPFLNGIRVFSRFQILVLFGLILMGSFALSRMDKRLPKNLKTVVYLVAALALLPGIRQFVALAIDMKSAPLTALNQQYPFPKVSVPSIAKQTQPASGNTMQAFLLGNGYWVGNCYEALSVPSMDWNGDILPLTSPQPPVKASLGTNYLELFFGEIHRQPGEQVLRLNLPVSRYLKFAPQPERIEAGLAWFDLEKIQKFGKLRVEADTTAVTTGVFLTILGVILTAFYLWWLKKLKV